MLEHFPIVVEQAVVWGEMDSYRHVNNVVYYAFFDTAVNGHLIRAGCLDVQASAVIGLVVETQCRYFKPITFPDVVHSRVASFTRAARLPAAAAR